MNVEVVSNGASAPRSILRKPPPPQFGKNIPALSGDPKCDTLPFTITPSKYGSPPHVEYKSKHQLVYKDQFTPALTPKTSSSGLGATSFDASAGSNAYYGGDTHLGNNDANNAATVSSVSVVPPLALSGASVNKVQNSPMVYYTNNSHHNQQSYNNHHLVSNNGGNVVATSVNRTCNNGGSLQTKTKFQEVKIIPPDQPAASVNQRACKLILVLFILIAVAVLCCSVILYSFTVERAKFTCELPKICDYGSGIVYSGSCC